MNAIYKFFVKRIWNKVDDALAKTYFYGNILALTGTVVTAIIVFCACTVYFAPGAADWAVDIVKTLFQWIGWM